MQKDIHPNYRPVVFKDMGGDFAFLTRSTIESNETIEWEDGNEYPLVKLEVTSATHPFYTGKQNIMDTTGKVERFNRRFGMMKGAKKQ
ncbi:50S ribosomal protein L31 [Salinisphaera shabanensis T35B1]|jgi:large subunit ribosomal protein L31|uniref:Large ribosomal subunit protein bL31B n=1 Tax=Salinisphaera shabanensis E1L3A TaxID=1033802 RepID=F7Q8W7_9GAMM|nr:type B 50S ribosomal protein L31 [Salinisphaera shabanensis]ERJ20063.1 50S ribosomal protein L31 type B [Salinisphaera shabanensis E1L3A]